MFFGIFSLAATPRVPLWANGLSRPVPDLWHEKCVPDHFSRGVYRSEASPERVDGPNDPAEAIHDQAPGLVAAVWPRRVAPRRPSPMGERRDFASGGFGADTKKRPAPFGAGAVPGLPE
ncbi:hypothetical protein J2S53_001819 [Actinopolyspora lacussalsi]|nr:hypothetical protein [Actinopolyspora lacussalsi]